MSELSCKNCRYANSIGAGPWCMYEALEHNPRFPMKEIVIPPGVWRTGGVLSDCPLMDAPEECR
jgi:hypothetical protein